MLLMSAFLFALWLSMQDDAPPDDDPDDDDPDDDDGGSGLPAAPPLLPRPWPPRIRLALPRSLPQPVPVTGGERRMAYGVRWGGRRTDHGHSTGPFAVRHAPFATL